MWGGPPAPPSERWSPANRQSECRLRYRPSGTGRLNRRALRRRAYRDQFLVPWFSASEVRVKEGGDAAARVLVGGLVVADAGPAKDLQEKVLVIVHEGVAGVGVLLYVVGDKRAFQSALQLVGDALLPLRLAAVAADHRAGRLEKVVHIGRQLATVVDAG